MSFHYRFICDPSALSSSSSAFTENSHIDSDLLGYQSVSFIVQPRPNAWAVVESDRALLDGFKSRKEPVRSCAFDHVPGNFHKCVRCNTRGARYKSGEEPPEVAKAEKYAYNRGHGDYHREVDPLFDLTPSERADILDAELGNPQTLRGLVDESEPMPNSMHMLEIVDLTNGTYEQAQIAAVRAALVLPPIPDNTANDPDDSGSDSSDSSDDSESNSDADSDISNFSLGPSILPLPVPAMSHGQDEATQILSRLERQFSVPQDADVGPDMFVLINNQYYLPMTFQSFRESMALYIAIPPYRAVLYDAHFGWEQSILFVPCLISQDNGQSPRLHHLPYAVAYDMFRVQETVDAMANIQVEEGNLQTQEQQPESGQEPEQEQEPAPLRYSGASQPFVPAAVQSEGSYFPEFIDTESPLSNSSSGPANAFSSSAADESATSGEGSSGTSGFKLNPAASEFKI
jgi:hypothetical protein